MKTTDMIKEPSIRVGLLKTTEKIEVRLNGAYTCPQVDEIFFNQDISINYIKGKIIIYLENGESFLSNQKVEFIPRDFEHNFFEIINMKTGADLHWQHLATNAFQGILSLEVNNQLIYLINEINTEKYLMSVISSEVSTRCHMEFLKTHAIISRSWLLANIGNNNSKENPQSAEDGLKWYDRKDHRYYDVCGNDHCQRYQGISKIVNLNSVWAVEETSGLVLSNCDEVCDARFSKCCGGVTESYENVWENKKIPYLTSIRDFKADDTQLDSEEKVREWIESSPPSFCNIEGDDLKEKFLLDYETGTKDFYRWEITYSNKRLSKIIQNKTGVDLGKIKSIGPIKRGPSGRIIKLEITGDKDAIIIGKELEIRRVLSETRLYSAALVFNISEDAITIKGAGWGHGVGLCQIGAAMMAEKGYSHKEILNHYFPNARILKIY